MKKSILVSEMAVIAIIPARGGSQGIKKKNIVNLSGKPLIAWSIEALFKSEVFTKIVVTSDDPSILAEAQKYGAETHMRTKVEDSNHVAMPDLPTLSYLETLDRKELPKHTFMVQCTSPLIKPYSYREAFETLTEIGSGTVFAAKDDHSFIWRQDKPNATLGFEPLGHSKYSRVGRQYVKYKQVKELGAFYGFRTKDFLDQRHRFFKDCVPILIKEEDSVDIDTLEDLQKAEYRLNKKMELPSDERG